MNKFSHLLLSASLPIALLGCAGAPPVATNASAPERAVSPQAYLTDPVGYVAAVVSPHSTPAPDENGMSSWLVKHDRVDDIQRAIGKWCQAAGGKVTQPAVHFYCVSPQNKALSQFTLARYAIGTKVGVLSGEAAQKKWERIASARDAHKRYLASGGAAGFLTLKDGTRIEVLRFGTPVAPLDYSLLSHDSTKPGRRLYEVRLVELVSDSDNQKRQYRITFQDGTVSNDYVLSNSITQEIPGTDRMQGTGVMFAGIGSAHMDVVVRRKPNAKPTNAAIATRDIRKLEITKIDNSPASPIAVVSSDPEIERAVLARWRAAAARKGRVPFNYDGLPSTWCGYTSNRPVEVGYLCTQLAVEREIASRRGYFDAAETPASLGAESMYDLAKRTIF